MSSFLKNDDISHPPVEEKERPRSFLVIFKEGESPASTEKNQTAGIIYNYKQLPIYIYTPVGS